VRKGRTSILVVDDDPRYVRSLRFNLEASDYDVLTALDGEAAIDVTATEQPDLILLDVRMPGPDGCQVCRRIREFSSVPIIMLTALGDVTDRIRGLEAGADDYVTKPFSASELVARVRAALRGRELSRGGREITTFQAGDLLVDLARRRVFIAGEEVHLTPIEYGLICELAVNAGRVLVPDYLLSQVWGPQYEGDTHLLWQAIHRLRQKIERDPENPELIQTRSGIGYILEVPD
jgi:DNA-binding response OmpR family regulator